MYTSFYLIRHYLLSEGGIMNFQSLAITFFIIGIFSIVLGLTWSHLLFKLKNQNSYTDEKRDEIRKAQIEAGKRAEQQVRFQLQYLETDDYDIWHNVHLESNGIRHEFDHLVFSPSGIIHIETKNYGGDLTFTLNGIEQIKRNYSGNILSQKNIKDPTGQLFHHEYLIKSILSQNKLAEIPVHGILCIANERATINGSPDGFHICKDTVLVPYIKQLDRNVDFTSQWRNSIIDLFEQYKINKEAS
ncbi:NERD domain-containing protein [Paenibacillus psychroresistens]|uniref:NERD domain-containing protein n=2 Tax=Paenibacillus psychroresistens TaxID=1778678 RepID=A0A6B8RMD6_9BACL|nr:NERD domain-containing protein [Paenibacillus psychroresistens]